MEVAHFNEIREEFIARVHTVVWCNVATIDRMDRPRSRILHPIWEVAGDPIAWIGTRPKTLKARHFEHRPYVSLAYIANIAKPVYADCKVEWIDSLEAKQHVWDLLKNTAEPLGYDPEPIFKQVDNPGFGLLRLTPWRLELGNFPGGSVVWHRKAESYG